jgi:phosphate transport system ATP-binding protein
MMIQLGTSTRVDAQGGYGMTDSKQAFQGSAPADFPAIRTELGVSGADVIGEHKKSEIPAKIAPNAEFDVSELNMFYGSAQALKNVNIQIYQKQITAIIGPSGCGKSTFLRCFNRMNDLVPGARVEGKVLFRGRDLYAPNIDPVAVRKTVGMVFQKPNPFPKSIFDNIAYGARINDIKGNMNEIVERALVQAELWDEVKDKLKQSGLALSGGQQQRLCIARTLAAQPEVILMDEPCASLDPIATLRIEDLMRELKKDFTIVIVTHNMQQAARVSDYTAMMMITEKAEGNRTGTVIEYGETRQLFTKPQDERTEDYITGRFG